VEEGERPNGLGCCGFHAIFWRFVGMRRPLVFLYLHAAAAKAVSCTPRRRFC
jgi:hypothetical protein